jgi:hypothetical protein
MLGLTPIGSLNTLMVDPSPPTWLPDMILRDLRVCDGKVTLRFCREEGGSSKGEVLHQQGKLHIIRQPALELLSAHWTERIAGTHRIAVDMNSARSACDRSGIVGPLGVETATVANLRNARGREQSLNTNAAHPKGLPGGFH